MICPALRKWPDSTARRTPPPGRAMSNRSRSRTSDLLSKMLHRQPYRVGRGLSKPADRGVSHGRAKLFEQRLVPMVALHQLDGLLAAHATGRALSTALIFEEFQHVERRFSCAVLVGQDNHRRGADEGAMRLKRVEIERHVIERRRKQPRGGPARLIGLELMPIEHATSRLDDIEDGGASGQQVNARLSDATGDGIGAQALAAIFLNRIKNLRPFLHDARNPVKRLHIVHERRLTEDADLRDEGRTVARLAALALDALDHRALFTADIGPRAAAQ